MSPELMDWSKFYPKYFGEGAVENDKNTLVNFADIGCGYGGLTGTFSF